MSIDDQELLVRINAATTSLEASLDRADKSVVTFERNVNRATRNVERRFDRMGRGVTTVMRRLIPLLSATYLSAASERYIGYADAVGVTANRLGVGVERLQEWRFAAEDASDVLQGQADTALQRFTRRVGEAAAGYGVLLPELERYNIALINADGTTRDAFDILLDYADAVQGAGSATEQLRLATVGFDTEGGPLVTLLRQGREGFLRYAEAAREAGILTAEQVAEAARLDAQYTRLSQTIRTELASAFIELGPILETAISGIRLVIQTINAATQAANFLFSSTAANSDMATHLFNNMVAPIEDAQAMLASGAPIGDAVARIEEGVRAYNQATGQMLDAAMAVRLFDQSFRELDGLPGQVENFLGPGLPPPANANGGGADRLRRAVQDLEAETDAIRRQSAAIATLNDQQLNRINLGLRLQEAHGGPILGDPEELAEIRRVIDAHDAAQAELALTEQAANLVNEALGRTGPSAEAFALAIDMVAINADRLGLTAEQVADATEALRQRWEDLQEPGAGLSDLAQQVGNSFASAFERAIFSGEKLSDVLAGLAEDLARLVIQQTILGPISGEIGTFIADLFHSGGIVGQGGHGRSVSPLAFVGAPRMHVGGLAGDEVPAILQRGEEVLRRDDPRHILNGGGGGIVIHQSIRIDAQAVNENGIDPASADVVGRQMRQAVKSAVQQEIAQQSRVGGMLNRV